MLNNTIQIKIKQRLNKLDSQDYDNLHTWQIIEAFNKAQIEWARRQIMGRNASQEGAEQSVRKVDDIQNILIPQPLQFTRNGDYFESQPLPDNYLEFHRVDVKASSDCCENKKDMIVYLAEEANAAVLYRDALKCPNFEWAETFCTIVNNKIRVYAKDFTVVSGTLTFYRQPVNIQIPGIVNPLTGVVSTTEVISEFRDDIVEILIDNAAAIIAGDIEAFNQFSRNEQAAEKNT